MRRGTMQWIVMVVGIGIAGTEIARAKNLDPGSSDPALLPANSEILAGVMPTFWQFGDDSEGSSLIDTLNTLPRGSGTRDTSIYSRQSVADVCADSEGDEGTYETDLQAQVDQDLNGQDPVTAYGVEVQIGGIEVSFTCIDTTQVAADSCAEDLKEIYDLCIAGRPKEEWSWCAGIYEEAVADCEDDAAALDAVYVSQVLLTGQVDMTTLGITSDGTFQVSGELVEYKTETDRHVKYCITDMALEFWSNSHVASGKVRDAFEVGLAVDLCW